LPVDGHTTKQMKHGCSWNIQICCPSVEMSHRPGNKQRDANTTQCNRVACTMMGWLVCGTGKLVSSSSSVSGGGGRGGAVSRGSGGRGGAWSTFAHQQHQHRSLAPPSELTTDSCHLNVWQHDFQIQLQPINAAMYIRLGLAAGCMRSTKRHVNKTAYVNVQHYAANISSSQQINVLRTAVTFSQYDLVTLFIYKCTHTIDKYLQYSIKTQILR